MLPCPLYWFWSSCVQINVAILCALPQWNSFCGSKFWDDNWASGNSMLCVLPPYFVVWVYVQINIIRSIPRSFIFGILPGAQLFSGTKIEDCEWVIWSRCFCYMELLWARKQVTYLNIMEHFLLFKKVGLSRDLFFVSLGLWIGLIVRFEDVVPFISGGVCPKRNHDLLR